jgi:hypothetical protein
MATLTTTIAVEQTGELAGVVWHTLQVHGPLSLAKLVKAIDAPRDMVLMAVGWLAREDKIAIDENSRGRFVSLR